MKRLQEVMENRGGSYILPFFWLHGEPHEVLREEIDKIEECGIREFCVESRPHPDFMGEQWWSDMDMILEEAKKRNMRVWLLDDDKFPTGHAAGGYEKNPKKSKIYVAERHMDICGPLEDGAVLVENFLGQDGQLLGIFACQKPDGSCSDVDIKDVIDLTNRVHDGIVYLDIPEGYYRLFVLFTTRKGGGRENYINLIDAASVRVLLEQVYEPHYLRYGKEFGKTFAGFFSDEPELGNVPGYGFQEKLGQKNVRLPWSNELAEMLKIRWGRQWVSKLIGLWYSSGLQTSEIRKDYMDCVSELVGKNFSGQIGDWCRKHGVEYIGHVIEDDNAHARLGCSVSHYFRAEKGMDMAGIDVVHLQIIPGFKEHDHQWIASDKDGEFFHYGLAKLGSSLAHLDKRKKGRALCEIFGSFGWVEGVWLMKWLTDHMLVRGINTFVPHAFSPKFPDRDCPPHFYARENNPQYPYFKELMKYMNRMCHLLNGGKMLAHVAVLYHGEAEWCADTELFQKPVRKLMERQIDCDVIWSDLLKKEECSFQDGLLCIHNLKYECLVIPGCQCLPDEIADFLVRAREAGFPVIFVNQYPQKCLGQEISLEEISAAANMVDEDALAETVNGICTKGEIQLECLEGCREDLRICTYVQEDGRIHMLFNEHPSKKIKIKVDFEEDKEEVLLHYDAVENSVFQVKNKYQILELAPGEAVVFICTRNNSCFYLDGYKCRKEGTDDGGTEWQQCCVLDGPWEIALKEAGIDSEFRVVEHNVSGNQLRSINRPDGYPHFSGTIRYTAEFECGENWNLGQEYILDFPGIHDGAMIQVNGKQTKILLGTPYRIEVGEFLEPGKNHIEIEVVNTLTWRVHDGQSTHMQMNPTGMVKAPVLYKMERKK